MVQPFIALDNNTVTWEIRVTNTYSGLPNKRTGTLINFQKKMHPVRSYQMVFCYSLSNKRTEILGNLSAGTLNRCGTFIRQSRVSEFRDR